ncbi:MAG: hypothetical protein DRH50_08435 [Deltaproteobacteria bacterium]|nr:MAG: hypothetical protein DRH50_08435 [Deltaproteobacteria bacterium]
MEATASAGYNAVSRKQHYSVTLFLCACLITTHVSHVNHMMELPLDKVMAFLKAVCPFSELPEPVLKGIVRTLLIEYFPEGEVILSAGPVDNAFLYLVSSGVTHCFKKDGAKVTTLRYVSERDHFGSETILTGRCRYTVQVVEDTICYLLKPEVFKELEGRFDGFRQYFQTINSPLSVQIAEHIAFREKSSLQQLPGRVNETSSQFKTSIGMLVSREPVCCGLKTTASEIARIMAFSGVGSVIVAEKETPLGIVTKNDLTAKVLARGRKSDIPASEIMSKNLLSLDRNDSCFEASLRMVENHCHHMVVTKEDRLYGVISQHDLILLQGANPVAVVGSIYKQKDVAGIKKCVRDMSIVQEVLLREGGRMPQIWALMSTFRDTLTRRLIVLAIEEMRKRGKELPVLNFCWITFGTPGRKETLLRENYLEGFIYKDPQGGLKDETVDYLKTLCAMVKDGLVECGLLDRKHGQVLCLSESKWREWFDGLMAGETPLDADNLRTFDFRGVCEEGKTVEELRQYVFEAARHKPRFLNQLRMRTNPTLIPVCFYRDQVVGSGTKRETLNLRNEVLTPLVGVVRLMALERGIMAFSTIERLRALCELGAIDGEKGKDLETGYEWFVRHCLQKALYEKRPLDWAVEPGKLSPDERRLYVESFRLVRDFVAGSEEE